MAFSKEREQPNSDVTGWKEDAFGLYVEPPVDWVIRVVSQ
jgi:hypothetical protein